MHECPAWPRLKTSNLVPVKSNLVSVQPSGMQVPGMNVQSGEQQVLPLYGGSSTQPPVKPLGALIHVVSTHLSTFDLVKPAGQKASLSVAQQSSSGEPGLNSSHAEKSHVSAPAARGIRLLRSSGTSSHRLEEPAEWRGRARLSGVMSSVASSAVQHCGKRVALDSAGCGHGGVAG